MHPFLKKLYDIHTKRGIIWSEKTALEARVFIDKYLKNQLEEDEKIVYDSLMYLFTTYEDSIPSFATIGDWGRFVTTIAPDYCHCFELDFEDFCKFPYV